MLRSSWLADALFQTLASLCPVWPGDNFLCGSAGLASACRTWPWCCEPQPWKHAGHAHTEAWFARLKDCGQLVASTVASGHQLGDMTPRMLLRMLNELRMITKPVSVKASPWFLEQLHAVSLSELIKLWEGSGLWNAKDNLASNSVCPLCIIIF